jgi:hypothetical protein
LSAAAVVVVVVHVVVVVDDDDVWVVIAAEPAVVQCLQPESDGAVSAVLQPASRPRSSADSRGSTHSVLAAIVVDSRKPKITPA